MNEKHIALLKLLGDNDYQSAEILSKKLSVSEKTVRNWIKEINIYLKKYNSEIVSKSSKGYKLAKASDFELISIINSKSLNNRNIPSNSSERKSSILKYVISNPNKVNADFFAKKLYVSKNTIERDLNDINDSLAKTELSFMRNKYYNFEVIGPEHEKRTYLTKHFYTYDIDRKEEEVSEVINTISSVVSSLFLEYNIIINEYSFENLISFIVVTIDRVLNDFRINHEFNCDELKLRDLAHKILLQINQVIPFSYNDNDISYLSTYLLSKITSDNKIFDKYSHESRSNISKMVSGMLEFIGDSLNLNLQNNLELILNLNQHMMPFDIRMKYNIHIENPMLESIKREYQFAYTVANEALTSVQTNYRHKINDEEIGYFALIFALALEEGNRDKIKKNILVVCPAGRASSSLFKQRYKRAFSEYINKIEECTINDISTYDLNGNEIDYVFTTISLEIDLPVPVYEVNLLPVPSELDEYKNIFESDNSQKLLKFYNSNLFISNLHAVSKEQVIKEMCNHAKKFYDLPNEFFESILIRESLGSTDYGNKSAIPHAYKIESDNNFVVVAILDKEILWEQNFVQVIFLVSIAAQRESSIDYFYTKTSELIFNEEKINQLIETPNFEHLIELLKST